MSEAYTNVAGQRLDLPEPAVALSGSTMGGSSYKVLGTLMQVVVIHLRAGQTVYTETGALSWMQDGIRMETNMRGGLGGILGRVFTGESLFVANFTAERDNALIAFSSEFPGKIIPINLAQGQSIVTQRDSFLVAEKSVNMAVQFQKKFGAFFGGEGILMQRFDGPGTVFVALDGEIVEYTLGPGERLKVDTGHVAMFEPTVSFNVEMVKGFKNILFGGEGLLFATLTGPGRVWLQTMPMSKLAGAIAQYLPQAEGSKQGLSINLGG
ncbi:MAG: TIGR00266 family protein [Anaerolineae bacterium]|nr:TIGR00266 family protein [Thermoflexales bacterium]MDW8408659.1 TIGR00266 family protein [Anaerolineae bacterium]